MDLYQQKVYSLNPVPTMITHGDCKFLVYSSCIKHVPKVMFYDMTLQKTVYQIKGAEVFIDFIPHPDDRDSIDEPKEPGRCICLTN